MWPNLQKKALSLTFDYSSQTQSFMRTLSNFTAKNDQGLSTLFLLTAFIKLSGKPYEQSKTLIEHWPTRRWLCATVQLCDIEQ